MASKSWQYSLSVVAMAALVASGAQAAEVTISGSLTSFQSALDALQGSNGDGSLDGVPLAIDGSLFLVTY